MIDNSENEIEQMRAQLAVLEADLAEFEQQYGVTTAEFVSRYWAGQTDDRMDYVEWASLAHMRDGLLEHLQSLGIADQTEES